jgi:hypothetical protein
MLRQHSITYLLLCFGRPRIWHSYITSQNIKCNANYYVYFSICLEEHLVRLPNQISNSSNQDEYYVREPQPTARWGWASLWVQGCTDIDLFIHLFILPIDPQAGRSQMGPGSTAETRKVVASPEQGLIYIKHSQEDQLLHFCWKNRLTNNVELVVFLTSCIYNTDTI